MTRQVFLVVMLGAAAIACNDEARRNAGFQPLLGKRTDAAIASFRASCDEKFAPSDPYGGPPFARFSIDHGPFAEHGDTDILNLECKMSNVTTYALSFFRDNVSNIWIDAPTEGDRLALFDRVFAPLVPNEVREPMRRSISEPDGFRFHAPTGYGRVRLDTSRTAPQSISWMAE